MRSQARAPGPGPVRERPAPVAAPHPIPLPALTACAARLATRGEREVRAEGASDHFFASAFGPECCHTPWSFSILATSGGM
jgi:hypothetical protein